MNDNKNTENGKENAEGAKTGVSGQKFTISYDLPETADHTIDAVTLGKSLISMAELIKESDKILNGEHSEVRVDVKAHKEGSFEVEYVVAWLQGGGIDVLKTIGITAASTTAAGATLFGILKHLRSRKIQTSLIQSTTNSRMSALLTLEDGTQVECDPKVRELLNSHSVRSKLATVIEQPAKNATSAKIKVFSGDEETVVIEQEDVPAFQAPVKRLFQEVEVGNRAANVTFIQVNNSSRNGWRARIRDEEFAVKMDDEGFMERMNAKQDFPVKDEMFEVNLETTKKIYDGKTSYSYRITEVKRHRTTEDKKII